MTSLASRPSRWCRFVDGLRSCSGGYEAIDIGINDQLKDGFGDAAQQITRIVLGQKFGQVDVVLPSRASVGNQRAMKSADR